MTEFLCTDVVTRDDLPGFFFHRFHTWGIASEGFFVFFLVWHFNNIVSVYCHTLGFEYLWDD